MSNHFRYPGWTVDAMAQMRLREKIAERLEQRRRFIEGLGRHE